MGQVNLRDEFVRDVVAQITERSLARLLGPKSVTPMLSAVLIWSSEP